MARRFGFPALVLGMLLWTLSSLAQTAWGTGQISGIVNDPNQAALAGAQVILTNSETQDKVAAVSDGQGTYLFSSLQPGNYVVEADANGFKPSASSALTWRRARASTPIWR